VSAVTSKASKTLAFLRSFMAAPQNIRELAYFALVRPKVEYAASAWSLWLLHDTTKLKKTTIKKCKIWNSDYHQTAIALASNMNDELRWGVEGRR